MPVTWNPTTVEQLEHVASELKKAEEKIASLLDMMLKNGMSEALAPWTPSHTKHLGAITKFTERMGADLPEQITAKKFKHKSRAATEKDRAKRTTRKGQSETLKGK